MSGRFPPRIFRRVPFEAELQLRYEPGDAEVVARTANVSLGGTFVVTSDPRPPGTTLELSFKLPEQPAPVRGRGRVAWVRERDEGPGRPAGMGVRFLELTPGSREQIFEVVERRVRDGGSAYDTGSEESGSIADRRDDTGPLPVAAGAAAGAAAASFASASAEPEATGSRVAASQEADASGVLRMPSPPSPSAPASPPGRPVAETAGWQTGGQPDAADEPDEPDQAGEAYEPPARPSAPAAGEGEPAAAEPWAPPPLPPVEMPEPEGRFAYPVGGAYSGRARGGARGWLIAAGAAVVVAAVAVAGWVLLAGGGTPRLAGGAATPRPVSGAGAGGGPQAGSRSADDRAAGPEDAQGTGPAAGTELTDVPVATRPGAGGGTEVGEGRDEGGTVSGIGAAEGPGAAGADRSAADRDAAGPGGGDRDAVATGGERSGGSDRDPARRPVPTDRSAVAGPPSEPSAPDGRLAAAADGSNTAATPAEPAPADPAAEASAPARRVTRITWQQRDGVTELVIWGDGRFLPGSYRSSSLGGERPRALIRLAGIVEPYAPGVVDVGTPQVSRVRTGHHVETDPDELHVVVDLAGAGVAASELRADGDRLWLRLEGR